MKELINARFLVPPIILICFVFLVNPEEGLNFVLKYHKALNIVTAPIIIFSLGFIISSISTFIINRFRWRSVLNERSKKIAKDIFPFLKNPDGGKEDFTDAEISAATWLSIAVSNKDGLKYIASQVDKNWHAFNFNLNSAVALVLSIIFTTVLIKGDLVTFLNSWWCSFLIIWLSCLGLFIANACDAHKVVEETDNILMRKREKYEHCRNRIIRG